MRPAAILKPNFHDGYCDSTGFGNAGVCETDDKGSFSNIRLPQSWDDAYQLCAARCLDCSRCNYVSLSLQWNDCSWFNECDLTSLHTEVRGHRSVRVRNATGRASFTSAEAPPQHEALWAHLRSLPRLSPGACWVQRCSAPRNHSLLAIGVAPVAHSWAADAEAHQSYGHIWRVVEAFFQCVVLEGIADAPFAATGSTPIRRRVLLPKSHRGSDGHTWALFRELVPLFSGSGTRLSISHAPLVPACPPPWAAEKQRCCHNASTRALLRQHYGGELKVAEMRPEPKHAQGADADATLRALRHVVWANLGVSDAQPDTVVFASNEGASNQRRIANEAVVARAVREAVAALKPQWRFLHQRLESLSYANELRLLRRTTMLIGLFGSGLHNCRFLPEGATVIQIHGALKGEIHRSSAYLYRDVCQTRMGLQWAGFAAPGWNCTWYGEDHPEDCEGAPDKEDFKTARVAPRAFAAFVRTALVGGEQRMGELARAYARDTFT